MKVELCKVRRAIVVEGEAHRLPDLSFRLFDLLLEQSPDPVSFSQIEEAVWNAQVTRETIKQRVTLLRESLEQIGIDGTVIEAVRNHGYRTILPKSAAEPARASPLRGRAGWAAGIVLLIAAALMLAWQIADVGKPAKPVLAVLAAAPAAGVDPGESETLRRDMVRTISKFEGVRVIDRVPTQSGEPDYLVRLSLGSSGQDRKLAAELVDSATGAVLFAEEYAVSPADSGRAVMHFANNVHGHLSAFAATGGEISDEGRTRYAEAYRLWRLGDKQSLFGARRSLDALAMEPETAVIARSLLARVNADMVMRHGEPAALARQAEQDLRALVGRQPGVGDLRYSLARALLAQGKREEAIAELRIAQRTMPFLDREIMAIEGEFNPRSATSNE
nr:winged helix-turn-helix domain-containing protein [Porphyrobacter sp. SLTP]